MLISFSSPGASQYKWDIVSKGELEEKRLLQDSGTSNTWSTMYSKFLSHTKKSFWEMLTEAQVLKPGGSTETGQELLEMRSAFLRPPGPGEPEAARGSRWCGATYAEGWGGRQVCRLFASRSHLSRPSRGCPALVHGMRGPPGGVCEHSKRSNPTLVVLAL